MPPEGQVDGDEGDGLPDEQPEDDSDLRETNFGWCVARKTPPRRKDMNWLKIPEQHVYFFDGDGWYRLDAPDRTFIAQGELPHG